MSRFAILKKVRRGAWTEDGEITVNVEQIVAIETEPGCGDECSRLTLSGGREVCVQGNHKIVRRAIVRQDAGRRETPEPSLFDQVFGSIERRRT